MSGKLKESQPLRLIFMVYINLQITPSKYWPIQMPETEKEVYQFSAPQKKTVCPLNLI